MIEPCSFSNLNTLLLGRQEGTRHLKILHQKSPDVFCGRQGPPGHGKSWNLGRPFSRPGKSWKIAKVMESHGKVMDNDDNVTEFLLLH